MNINAHTHVIIINIYARACVRVCVCGGGHLWEHESVKERNEGKRKMRKGERKCKQEKAGKGETVQEMKKKERKVETREAINFYFLFLYIINLKYIIKYKLLLSFYFYKI